MIQRRGFLGGLAGLLGLSCFRGKANTEIPSSEHGVTTGQTRDPNVHVNPTLKPGETQVDLVVVHEEDGTYTLRTYIDTTSGTFGHSRPIICPGFGLLQSFIVLSPEQGRVLSLIPIGLQSAPINEDAIREARYNPTRRTYAESGFSSQVWC